MKKMFKKIYIILLLLLIIFCYSLYIEPNKLVVNQQKVYLSNWDSSLDGFKIVVVADLHIGTKHVPLKKLEKVVDIVNAQNPNQVFILGDFDAMSIVYSKFSASEISSVLSGLKGSYAVLGNHDYVPAAVVRPILKNAGIKLLTDKSDYIYFNNKKIRICGIEDIWHNRVNVQEVIGNITEPTIFLSHNPDVFPLVPEKVSLTLAGHTHGGEISFPFLGAPFVPSVYAQKYTKGHIVEDGKQMFVTSGVASLSRLRLFNPPEIVVLELYSKDTVPEAKTSTKFLHRFIQSYNQNKYSRFVHCY